MVTSQEAAFVAEGVASLRNVALREAVQNASIQLSGQAQAVMLTFARTLEREYRNRRGRMTTINRTVGAEAQAKVISSYLSRVNQAGTPPYRANASGKFKRYAGGKMLQALQDPSFFKGTALALEFINEQLLDRKAKQWYRLNYGAGPRGKSGPYKAQEHKLKFFEETVGVVSLKGMQPSEAYNMPRGFFVNPQTSKPQKLGSSRGDIFVPIRSSSARTVKKKGGGPRQSQIWTGGRSQGFGGFHFFDLGVRHIARKWPTENLRMFNDWVKEAAAAGTGPVAKIAVPKSQVNKQLAVLNRELIRLKVRSS